MKALRFKRSLTVLSLATATLLAGEMATRWLAPALPQPPIWYDDFSRLKVNQMDRFVDLGRTFDVALVGTSSIGYAVDPRIFTTHDSLHRTAYNASLHGAYPEITQRWLIEQVIPRLDPEVVVLGFNSFDLFGRGQEDHHLEVYSHAPMLRTGLMSEVERALVQNSYLFRYRRALRDPGVLLNAVRDRLTGKKNDSVLGGGSFGNRAHAGDLGPYGEDQVPLGQSYHLRPDMVQGALARWEQGFVPSDDQFQAVSSLTNQLRALGIHLVFVRLPATSDYETYHPGGATDVARFQNALRRLADDLDIPLLIPPEHFELKRLFYDPVHMNPDGMRAFSIWLAQVLPEL